jgi:hypothetical protein
MIDPSAKNRMADWLGNRANIARSAATKNDEVATRLAKVDAGIPAASDLSEESIARSLNQIADEYYVPITRKGPAAAAALDEYQSAKVDWQDAQVVRSRDRTREAKAALADAEASFANAKGALESIIGKDGMKKLSEGETKYAKAIRVRDSSNLDSGSIEPSKLAKNGDLTDNLKTVADFNGAVGNRISKEITKIESPIVGRLFSGVAGGAGYAAGGLGGAAAGLAAPIALEEFVRRFQLSGHVQRKLAQPVYTYGQSQNDRAAAFMSQLVAGMGVQRGEKLTEGQQRYLNMAAQRRMPQPPQ